MEPSGTTEMVGITEITQRYLPMSKRKARKFVSLYLNPVQIGNRIYVNRKQLENLLRNPARDRFPMDF